MGYLVFVLRGMVSKRKGMLKGSLRKMPVFRKKKNKERPLEQIRPKTGRVKEGFRFSIALIKSGYLGKGTS